MQRGRKPVPPALALVTTKPAELKARAKKGAPLVEEEDLTDLKRAYPDWFSEKHVREWQFLLENIPESLLKQLDYPILVAHVVAVVEHAKAAELLRTSPMLEETPNGHLQASPYYGIMNRQAEIICRTAAEMGFTPSSRARVVPNAKKARKPGKQDPKAEFFG